MRQLTAPANLHPYVFRTASNTTIEGRTAAEIMAKWPVKRIATIAPDYAYGQDVAKSFVEHIKKLKPDVEIVDQQWPKLGEPCTGPRPARGGTVCCLHSGGGAGFAQGDPLRLGFRI